MDISIIFVDDLNIMDSPLVQRIKEDMNYDTRQIFSPNVAQTTLLSNLGKAHVVLLDLDFGGIQLSPEAIKTLSTISALNRFIIYSGNLEKLSGAHAEALVNSEAFFVLPRDTDATRVIAVLQSAIRNLEQSPRALLEKWIIQNKSSDLQDAFGSVNGYIYTYQDILDAIRGSGSINLDSIVKDIMTLATEMISTNITP